MGVLQRVVLGGLAWALSGCDMDLERQSQVTRVRVLAVRATPAELALPPDSREAPGPVRLEALAVAPDDRPLTVRFALCRPGNVYARDFQCPGRDGVDLPEGQLVAGEAGVAEVLAQWVALGGGDLEAGVPFYVGYEVSDGSGSPEGGERGVRRMSARATATPNGNPRLEDVLYQGASLAGPLPLGSEVELTPVLAPDSQEAYEGPGGSATESVTFAWHATGTGEVAFFRSVDPGAASTEYTTPDSPQQVTFYVVARDGRGGTGWLTRTVEVR